MKILKAGNLRQSISGILDEELVPSLKQSLQDGDWEGALTVLEHLKKILTSAKDLDGLLVANEGAQGLDMAELKSAVEKLTKMTVSSSYPELRKELRKLEKSLMTDQTEANRKQAQEGLIQPVGLTTSTDADKVKSHKLPEDVPDKVEVKSGKYLQVGETAIEKAQQLLKQVGSRTDEERLEAHFGPGWKEEGKTVKDLPSRGSGVDKGGPGSGKKTGAFQPLHEPKYTPVGPPLETPIKDTRDWTPVRAKRGGGKA